MAGSKRKKTAAEKAEEERERLEQERRNAANASFVEKARKQWECAMCLGIAFPHRDPTVLPCTHVFCRPCIEEVHKRAEQGASACPSCSKAFGVGDLVPLKSQALSYRVLLNLSVPCPLECAWIGDVGDLSSHWDSCVNAKCEGCGDVFKPPATKKDHVEVCPKVPVPCSNEGCGQRVPRETFQGHLETCPHGMVSCSEPGCIEKVKRKDLSRHRDNYQLHYTQIKALFPPLESGNCCSTYQRATIFLPDDLVPPTDAQKQDPSLRVYLPSVMAHCDGAGLL
ncbi:hypothetical protein DFJ74DRAFT_120782 [Hyaloraphidium curvatum]|nr:hypothetical protein DFJ74DRAFT_120782 [Hyaloraphidium curvatum]